MVTLTFTGTPSEIHSDMRDMLNLTTGAAATRPSLSKTEEILRINKIPTGPSNASMDSLTGLQDVEVESLPEADGLLAASKSHAAGPTRTRTEIEHKMTEAQAMGAAPIEKKTRTRRTKAEMASTRNPEESFEAKQHDTRAEEETGPDVMQHDRPMPSKVNKQTVHEALQQVNVAVGLPKAREILTHFKVNRMSELKAEDYGAFIEKCNEATMMA